MYYLGKHLSEIWCEHCNCLINNVQNISRKGLHLFSGMGKVACSSSCSKTLSNLERHKQNPEWRNKFTGGAAKKMRENGFKGFHNSEETANRRRREISKQMSSNNSKWHSSHSSEKRKDMIENAREIIQKTFKGKTFQEIYGDKAEDMLISMSKRFSGEGNPMFGKPSSHYSGGGMVGKFGDFFFRSMLELSYIIEMQEKGVHIEQAENGTFRVEYVDDVGQKRNYFPDFYLPDTNTVIEIKHSRALKKKDRLLELKIEAAKQNFENFTLITEKEIKMIDFKQLWILVNEDKVTLCERSMKKLTKYINSL